MKLDVEILGIEGFLSTLRNAEREQTPFATAQALNAVAFKIRGAWQEEAKSKLDRPTPFVVGAALFERATKQTMEAKVFMRGGEGRTPAKILGAHVDGGMRGTKGTERKLREAGVMRGAFFVPGRGAKLDNRGNLARSDVQILANLSRGGGAPPGAEGTQARRRRRRKEGEAFATDIGVLQRVGGQLRSIAYFVNGVRYEPRLDLFTLGTRVFEASYASEFDAALSRALASSR